MPDPNQMPQNPLGGQPTQAPPQAPAAQPQAQASAKSETYLDAYSGFHDLVKSNNPGATKLANEIIQSNPKGLTKQKFVMELQKRAPQVFNGFTITGLDPEPAAQPQQGQGDKVFSVGDKSVVLPEHVPSQKASQRAWKNNNPGNLRFADQPGATKGEDGFAVFTKPEEGFAALTHQIGLDADRGMKLGEYIQKFAPPSENDTPGYIHRVTQELGFDSPNVPLSSINPNKLAQIQAGVESGSKTSQPKQLPKAPKQEVAQQKPAEEQSFGSKLYGALTTSPIEGLKNSTGKIGDLGKGKGKTAEFGAGFAQGVAEAGIDMTSLANVGLTAVTVLGPGELKLASKLPKALKFAKYIPQLARGVFTAQMYGDLAQELGGGFTSLYEKGDYKAAGTYAAKALVDAYFLKVAHGAKPKDETSLLQKGKDWWSGKKTDEPPPPPPPGAPKASTESTAKAKPATEAKPADLKVRSGEKMGDYRQRNFIAKDGKWYAKGQDDRGYSNAELQDLWKNDGKLSPKEETSEAEEKPAKAAAKPNPSVEYYQNRLNNQELLKKSIDLKDPSGDPTGVLAVPVGGSRKGGELDWVGTKQHAEELAEKLRGQPGFPDVAVTKYGYGHHVQWGESVPEGASHVETGKHFGYSKTATDAYGKVEGADPTQILPKSGPRLPQNLAGATPDYNYGKRNLKLNFQSDLDKAAYIAAGEKPSKADAEYVKWAQQVGGYTEDELRMRGRNLKKEVIKDMAVLADHGDTLQIPETIKPKGKLAPAQEPRKATVSKAGQPKAAPAAHKVTAEPTKKDKLGLSPSAVKVLGDVSRQKITNPKAREAAIRSAAAEVGIEDPKQLKAIGDVLTKRAEAAKPPQKPKAQLVVDAIQKLKPEAARELIGKLDPKDKAEVLKLLGATTKTAKPPAKATAAPPEATPKAEAAPAPKATPAPKPEVATEDKPEFKALPENLRKLHKAIAAAPDNEARKGILRKYPTLAKPYLEAMSKLNGVEKEVSTEGIDIKALAAEKPKEAIQWLMKNRGMGAEAAKNVVKQHTYKPIEAKAAPTAKKTAEPPSKPVPQIPTPKNVTRNTGEANQRAVGVAQEMKKRIGVATTSPSHYPVELEYKDAQGKTIGKHTINSPQAMDDAMLDISNNLLEHPDIAQIGYRREGASGVGIVDTMAKEAAKTPRRVGTDYVQGSPIRPTDPVPEEPEGLWQGEKEDWPYKGLAEKVQGKEALNSIREEKVKSEWKDEPAWYQDTPRDRPPWKEVVDAYAKYKAKMEGEYTQHIKDFSADYAEGKGDAKWYKPEAQGGAPAKGDKLTDEYGDEYTYLGKDKKGRHIVKDPSGGVEYKDISDEEFAQEFKKEEK